MTSLLRQVVFVFLAIILLIMVVLGTVSMIDLTPEPRWKDCRVKNVWDADSITLKISGNNISVRLAGVDAPNAGQPFYRQSTDFVRKNTKDVNCQWAKTGKYDDRECGILRFDGGAWAGEELNRIVLSQGYGWWEPDTSYDDGLEDLEAEARKNGLGIWRRD